MLVNEAIFKTQAFSSICKRKEFLTLKPESITREEKGEKLK